MSRQDKKRASQIKHLSQRLRSRVLLIESLQQRYLMASDLDTIALAAAFDTKSASFAPPIAAPTHTTFYGPIQSPPTIGSISTIASQSQPNKVLTLSTSLSSDDAKLVQLNYPGHAFENADSRFVYANTQIDLATWLESELGEVPRSLTIKSVSNRSLFEAIPTIDENGTLIFRASGQPGLSSNAQVAVSVATSRYSNVTLNIDVKLDNERLAKPFQIVSAEGEGEGNNQAEGEGDGDGSEGSSQTSGSSTSSTMSSPHSSTHSSTMSSTTSSTMSSTSSSMPPTLTVDSVAAAFPGNLHVVYTISNGTYAPFELNFIASLDSNLSMDDALLIAQRIETADGLTVGTHWLDWIAAYDLPEGNPTLFAAALTPTSHEVISAVAVVDPASIDSVPEPMDLVVCTSGTDASQLEIEFSYYYLISPVAASELDFQFLITESKNDSSSLDDVILKTLPANMASAVSMASMHPNEQRFILTFAADFSVAPGQILIVRSAPLTTSATTFAVAAASLTKDARITSEGILEVYGTNDSENITVALDVSTNIYSVRFEPNSFLLTSYGALTRLVSPNVPVVGYRIELFDGNDTLDTVINPDQRAYFKQTIYAGNGNDDITTNGRRAQASAHILSRLW